MLIYRKWSIFYVTRSVGKELKFLFKVRMEEKNLSVKKAGYRNCRLLIKTLSNKLKTRGVTAKSTIHTACVR